MNPDAPRPLPSHVDVAIVGANVAGLHAAATLATGGVDVLVLDGASDLDDAAARQDRQGHAFHGLIDSPWRLCRSLGREETLAILRLGADGLERLRAAKRGGVPSGLGWAATEPDREPPELAHSAALLQSMGVPVEPLRPADLSDRFGTTHLGPGLWLPSETALDGAELTHLFRHLARHPRVRLGWRAPVLRVEDRHVGVRLHLTADDALDAEVVILTGGYELQRAAEELRDVLVPIREVRVRLNCPPGLSWGMRAGFGWTALTRHARGEVDLSGCRWASPHLEEGETDASRWHPAVEERLVASARRFVPDVQSLRSVRAWIDTTGCDGVPIVGPSPSSPRLLYCAGFGPNDLALGAASGVQVAQGLLHGTAPLVPRSFNPARFIG